MRRNIIAALALLLCEAGLTAAAVAQQPVKLGVLNDQTGLYADLTGMGSVHAARMAVEDYGGKVLGRPIEVIFADHQNKPDIGANIARQWIENNAVNVILDLPNSAVGLAVREVTRTHDAVDINTGAATSDLSGKACSPHGVHWTFDTYGLAATTGRAVVKQGGDTWFFIPPTTHSGMPSSATPRRSSRPAAARWWGLCAIRSILPTSRPFCCRRKPRRRRSSVSRTPAATPSTRSNRPRNSA
jgi:hypothetical protein